LFRISSYPLCKIGGHRPESATIPNSRAVPLLTQPGDSSDDSPYLPSCPSHGGSTVPQQSEQVNILVGPLSSSDSTTPGEVGDNSRAPAAASPTSPVHTSSRPTDASRSGAVAAALQGVSPDDMLSPLEGTTQLDIVVSCAERDMDETLSTAFTSFGPGAASTSSPSPPALSVSILASPIPSRVPPLPNPDPLASVTPAAGIAAPSFVCSEDPTPQIHTRESGEASQAPVEPLILLHPDPVLATVTPSTGLDPGDEPDALQRTTSPASPSFAESVPLQPDHIRHML
jgi:hypothetical protein